MQVNSVCAQSVSVCEVVSTLILHVSQGHLLHSFSHVAIVPELKVTLDKKAVMVSRAFKDILFF